MSSYEGRCPECGDLMEKRDFMDGGEDGDINPDWWCTNCCLRWVAMNTEPMEAES